MGKGFCQKICILDCTSDIPDCDGTGTYLISKMVPLDDNMLGSRAIFGILIGNNKSSLIVFKDKGLKLHSDNVGPGMADTACQGWMRPFSG
jgi:hypothetical protein